MYVEFVSILHWIIHYIFSSLCIGHRFWFCGHFKSISEFCTANNHVSHHKFRIISFNRSVKFCWFIRNPFNLKLKETVCSLFYFIFFCLDICSTNFDVALESYLRGISLRFQVNAHIFITNIYFYLTVTFIVEYHFENIVKLSIFARFNNSL